MKFRSYMLVVLFVLSAVVAGNLYAESWNLSVDASLTLTQNTYSDNWAGGEWGQISWLFNSNSLAEREFGEKVSCKNTLKLFYGQTHMQDAGTKRWRKPVKSNDLIDFESVFLFKLFPMVDTYAGFRVEGAFFDTSDPENYRYINPLKFTESLGLARVLIDTEKHDWIVRFGGGFREFVDRDRLDPLTKEKETSKSNDGGFIFDSELKTVFAGDRVTFTSKLTVFKAIYNSEADELEEVAGGDYWKAPDVNWENIISANITKYLVVNMYIQLLYDKEVDLGGRFKETLSFGLTYKLL